MRINEYKNLNNFIYEYDSGRHSSDENHGRKFMGIEFLYDNNYYRMCREPVDDEKGGIYEVSIMNCAKLGYPVVDKFELIGAYKNIYDLLNNCVIAGKKFKDVIIDDKTQILSKD